MDISGIALSGLDRAQAALEASTSRLSRIAPPTSDGGPVDAVDLSAAAVDMLAARLDFAVNLKVLKIADRIERRALDILA